MKQLVRILSEGEFVGDYQILSQLGRGSFGTTYHVMSRVLGKEFAIKVFRITEAMPLDWLERLEAQVALVGKLASPHVDRILASGRDGDLWYCVKDFIHDGEGQACHLGQYRERHGGKLSSFQVAHIVRQILKGLKSAAEMRDAHHRGIFHGNLKPENVLVAFQDQGSSPCEVLISDFQPYGLFGCEQLQELFGSWQEELERQSAYHVDSALPEGLQAIFSGYDYRPPEWKPGTQPDLKADTYALGMLVYEMLTGTVCDKRFEDLGPEFPEHWSRLIRWCLESDPSARCDNYDELLSLIEDEEEPELQVMTSPVPQERLSLTPHRMVYIPAGRFLVGSEESGEDASPEHEVDTKGFYIDRAPVTIRQFAQFIQETGYETDAERNGGAPVWVGGEWQSFETVNWKNPLQRPLPDDFEEHPVTQITLADAKAYAEWAGKRLPTEQEWEIAARGGRHGLKFPLGDTLTLSQANFGSDGTSPVMRYPPNPYGLFDIAGNVWEWTDSWYEAYPSYMGSNPHFGQSYKVVRGGCWLHDASHCLVSYRNASEPDHCYPTVGLRLVKDFG